MNDKSYWVYILLCNNKSYYTGYTTDLEKRYQLHLAGKASKFTRSFKPLKIAQSWHVKNDLSQAMKMECFIKKLTRAQKEEIIQFPDKLFLNMK